jgi:hypothetical protein
MSTDARTLTTDALSQTLTTGYGRADIPRVEDVLRELDTRPTSWEAPPLSNVADLVLGGRLDRDGSYRGPLVRRPSG